MKNIKEIAEALLSNKVIKCKSFKKEVNNYNDTGYIGWMLRDFLVNNSELTLDDVNYHNSVVRSERQLKIAKPKNKEIRMSNIENLVSAVSETGENITHYCKKGVEK